MWEIAYEKNEGTVATITFTATGIDATGAPGFVDVWNGGTLVAVFNKDTFVYARKLS